MISVSVGIVEFIEMNMNSVMCMVENICELEILPVIFIEE